MEVVEVLDEYKEKDGNIIIKQILVDEINNNTVMAETKKSTGSGLLNKLKARYIPEINKLLRLSYNCKVCFPGEDGEYTFFDGNTLTSIPSELIIDKDIVFTIMVPWNNIKENDIIQKGNIFYKVLERKETVCYCIDSLGNKATQVPIKDMLLNANLVRKVFDFGGNSGNNNFMMLALAGEENNKESNLLPYMMMMQQGNQNNNMLMPMLLLGHSQLKEDLLLMMAMQNGCLNFGNPTPAPKEVSE